MAHEDSATVDAGRAPLLTRTPVVLLACVFCCLLWGSAFPCIKIGYRLFSVAAGDPASQLLFAGVRFTLAGAMVVVGTSLTRRRPLLPSRGDWGAILTLGTFQTFLQYFFFYQGLSKASGVTSSIIGASSNFLAIVFAALLFRTERLTGRKVLGCTLGFAGVVLVNVAGRGLATGSGPTLDGEGLVLVSTCSGAMSTCLIQRLSAAHDPVLLSGWQFVVGGTALVALGVAGDGSLRPSGPAAWALLGYMAFISAAAYSLWSLLLRVNPVSRISVFGFMNPVFGALLSALLLGEHQLVDPLRALAALGLVSAGIVVVNLVGPGAYGRKGCS